jgi:outer membrane receptor protein involved in Fe transport
LVSQARPIELEISLKPKPIEMGAVEVKGNTFSKSSGATLSTFNVDQAELRSDPVGVYDVQRMVINLPSVSTASDQENEIIARGGLPGENLFLMDGIEISNPNHFGMDGAGGGPINMVNPLFVREIEFTPGAFSAKYGDKASSVMDVSLRNGSRKSFEYDANVSMAGAGLNIEGPIENGRGSFLASSNWSYLDLILTSIGLTAVPKYNNHQSKIVYDLDKNNQLTFNTLLGFDAIHIQGGDDVVSRGAESVDHKGNTIVAGIGLRTILNSNSYRKILLSQVFNNYNNIVYDYPDKSNPWYTINNANKETTFKS